MIIESCKCKDWFFAIEFGEVMGIWIKEKLLMGRVDGLMEKGLWQEGFEKGFDEKFFVMRLEYRNGLE